jgi:signal transduction histidine kinase
MLSDFLDVERLELIARCRSKASQRQNGIAGTERAGSHGVPEFLEQLIRTLRMEATPANGPGASLPGLHGDMRATRSDLGESAALHGREIFLRGDAVEAVIHAYGDLCQAITELADERNASIAVPEFRTLNRCLDNAIADAVKEYAYAQSEVSRNAALAMNQRHGSFVHELRNHVGTALLSFDLVRAGRVTPNGATGAIVDRSLHALRDLIERGIDEARTGVADLTRHYLIPLSQFIADLHDSELLNADARGCELSVSEVDPTLAVDADAILLSGALSNLLRNAFKFTCRGTTVRLDAHAAGDRILLSVSDQCGGIPAEALGSLFQPFVQHDADRTGLGLGLSICRKYVEACAGTLTCRNMPGEGCVFTIDLPRHVLEPAPPLDHASALDSPIANAPGRAL